MNRYRDGVLRGLRIPWGRPFGKRAMPPAPSDRVSVGRRHLERSLKDVADLVFTAVYVEPVAGFGLECRFEEVVPATRLPARQLVRDGKEIQHPARLRRHEYRMCTVSLHALPSLAVLTPAV